MKVAVVSACYGGYDEPKPPTPQDTEHEVTFVMVTDGTKWDGWRNVVEKRPHLHPNLAAKFPKLFPFNYAPVADYTIWVDAGSTFSPEMVERVLSRDADWTMFKGTRHSTLQEEIGASRTMRKYDVLDLERQAEYYIVDAYPDEELWGTGIIGRSWCRKGREAAQDWLAEILRWGWQDQLSFAYVKWSHDLHVVDLGPPDGFTSDIIQFADHTRKP